VSADVLMALDSPMSCAAPPCYDAANSGACSGGGGTGGDAQPPPGTGGGAGPQNRDLLGAALDQALADLLKPNCAQSVFGGGIAKGYDPAMVLEDIVSGTKYGSIQFALLSPLIGADEVTNGILRWKKATITINTYNGPSATYWNAGNASVNAYTLLHELGHAFNGLFGNGSSAIVFDANPDGSPNTVNEDHNAEVMAPCK
jgi:hypothetical protein